MAPHGGVRIDNLRQGLRRHRFISHVPQPVNVAIGGHEFVVVAAPYPQLPPGSIVETVGEKHHEEVILLLREYFWRERDIAHNPGDLLGSSDERPDVIQIEGPLDVS